MLKKRPTSRRRNKGKQSLLPLPTQPTQPPAPGSDADHCRAALRVIIKSHVRAGWVPTPVCRFFTPHPPPTVQPRAPRLAAAWLASCRALGGSFSSAAPCCLVRTTQGQRPPGKAHCKPVVFYKCRALFL